jgi:NAD(P)-dependent dehydrogenase (short-subunit alcohol dehydrogenase family)
MGVDFDLKGKTALITGAGRGIGMGMAEALAAAGCAVAVQDIEEPVAQEVVDRIVAAGGKAVALGGDVTDLSLAPVLIHQTIEKFGGMHILINNAAIQKFVPLAEISTDELEREYRANVITPLLLCKEVIPIFRQQKWGRIINLGSILQRRGSDTTVAYSMTKSAMWNMTKSLTRKLAEDGITINLIAPGYFDTWRTRNDKQRANQNFKEWIPLNRMGQPNDCAGMALLLCSEAGSYITGQSIHVDGGMSV